MTTGQSTLQVTLREEHYRKKVFYFPLYLLSQMVKGALCTTSDQILRLHFL